MAEVITACSSCAKNDVCRHVEDVEKLKAELEEKKLSEPIQVTVGCSRKVRILQSPITYRGC